MLSAILSGQFEPMNLVLSLISSLIVVFLTLPIHEWAHGFVATKLGDPTPRYTGRLTLNPFAHIDYVGALCIILFGIGWAKPVQINPRNFKNPKIGMAITAFAGPAMNILVATLSIFLLNAVYVFGSFLGVFANWLLVVLSGVAQINVFLAVFNMIPVPPFDGSRIMFAVLPDKYYFKVMEHERILMFAMLLIIATDVLDVPLRLASNFILDIIFTVTTLPFMFLG